ncbi:MAG: SDR family oxidoreductase [Neptuniibacter sp.]|nr:SDR family oxidoreductase [Neptuniibacter sp.]
MSSQNNKLVFVTGASRGIGRAIAEGFISSGFKVAVGYRDNKTTAESICEGKKNAIAVQLEINSRESIQKAKAIAEDFFALPISILVNNAGIAQEKPFLEITDDDWDHMLGVNLRSNFTFSQEVIPEMVKNNWGRIINISSIGGQWGGFNQVHYAAAKAGQINLTRSIAKIYSGSGITCNAIAIGLAQTDMAAREIESSEGQKKIEGIPAGRLAETSEVAETALFLASDGGAYITGQTINLNGGMYFV